VKNPVPESAGVIEVMMRKVLQGGPVQAGVNQMKFAPGPEMGQNVPDDQAGGGETVDRCCHDDDIEGEVLKDI